MTYVFNVRSGLLLPGKKKALVNQHIHSEAG